MGNVGEREAVAESGIRLVRGWGNRALAGALLAWPNRWRHATLDVAQAHPEWFENLDVGDVVEVLDQYEGWPAR